MAQATVTSVTLVTTSASIGDGDPIPQARPVPWRRRGVTRALGR